MSRDGSRARRGSSGGPFAQRTARLPGRMWEAAAAWPPGSSRRLCVGLLVSRPRGLGEMYTNDVGGFVNPDFSPSSVRFFFLILQDGELPLISLLLWRVIDLPLFPIMQHSPEKGDAFTGFLVGFLVICQHVSSPSLFRNCSEELMEIYALQCLIL